MEQNERETLVSFIKSNNFFYSAIKSNSNNIKEINRFIKIELIMLYFSINRKTVEELDSIMSKLIIDILDNQDFYVENEGIKYHEHFITIDSLMIFMNLIERVRVKYPYDCESDGTIIYYPKNSKILPIPTLNNCNMYTLQERAKIFECTSQIDYITKPYLEDTNQNFVEKINETIIKILTNNINNYNQLFFQLLISFISLYPYVSYLKDKVDFSFQDLNLPQNEISLIKIRSNNPEMLEISSRIKKIDNIKANLNRKNGYIELYNPNNLTLKNEIKRSILSLEQEKNSKMINYFTKQSSPDIYNKNLLEYMFKSFVQGNIDIKETHRDPVLEMFYIEGNIVEFHSAMHLSSLFKIIQSVSLELSEPHTKTLKP